ncbi:YlbL family protein [Herbiconiux sp. SYSU D00978]|uniref:YlbL family protein n=1 Tax=Herbiconiux sp. SYSU D00978 TaxID=2812562 RepID=UPI0027DBA37E|nr:S16 family serine protease [Herbiconiux sp. SYSU D00978]
MIRASGPAWTLRPRRTRKEFSLALFVDDSPRLSSPPSSPRRRRAGWLALLTSLLAALALTLLPSPYVVQQPGPVYDTLGPGAEGEDLVEIRGATTYETEGSLDMLTVSVYGNRDDRPNWIEVAGAWVDPQRAIVPVESIYPSGTTTDEIDEQNLVEMSNSQQTAVAVALTELGYDFESRVLVGAVSEGAPADGVLQEGDEVTAVDGQAVATESELRAAIEARAPGDDISLTVVRDGATSDQLVTAADAGGRTVIGIAPAVQYTFPLQVDITLDGVGGPSAGMMFTLAIIDKLTEGPLTGGEDIAGTGTISADGTVGRIGGIRQKLFAAEREGVEWFLAPEGNCAEVVGHVPDGLEVFPVGTLDEALEVTQTIAEDGDVSELARCEAG